MKKLYQRALRLEYFTVGYNAAEAVASLIAGMIIAVLFKEGRELLFEEIEYEKE